MRAALRSVVKKVSNQLPHTSEAALMLLGKQMSWQVAAMPPNTDFRQVGFKVFSQWDEDGIIQYLIHHLPVPNRTFIEFGVEDYEESNTRFLLLNDHWQGMVLEARESDVHYIQQDKIHWQYDLQVRQTWITRENIDGLMRGAGFGEDLGLLSIDIDGNDYWIWEAIQSVRPRILIIEYNSLLGLEPVAVPYSETFQRTASHYSNLYYGASLGALHALARRKGYLLLGSNVWGHNAFFVREDVAGEFRGLSPREAYVASKFRESRDPSGNLTFLRGSDRVKLIEEMPVVQVESGETHPLKNLWRQP